MANFNQLCEIINSTPPETIVKIIVDKATQGGQELDAALLLFKDLIEETKKAPIINSLEVLMEEPILANGFKNFLRERFCYECWEFWLDARTFRSSYDSYPSNLDRTAYVDVRSSF